LVNGYLLLHPLHTRLILWKWKIWSRFKESTHKDFFTKLPNLVFCEFRIVLKSEPKAKRFWKNCFFGEKETQFYKLEAVTCVPKNPYKISEVIFSTLTFKKKLFRSNWTNELDALYLVRFYGVFLTLLVWKILFEGYKQSLKNYFNALQYRLEFKTAGVYWLWYHQNIVVVVSFRTGG
jgi:hypothetical protein